MLRNENLALKDLLTMWYFVATGLKIALKYHSGILKWRIKTDFKSSSDQNITIF